MTHSARVSGLKEPHFVSPMTKTLYYLETQLEMVRFMESQRCPVGIHYYFMTVAVQKRIVDERGISSLSPSKNYKRLL